METVDLEINGVAVTALKSVTVLGAARLTHIEIPVLCFLKGANETGACRICIIELKGRGLVTFYVYSIEEDMEVFTNTPKVLDSRKKTPQLLLSSHNHSCLSCICSRHCELQELAHELGAEDEVYYDGEKTPSEIDYSVTHMIRDNNKCILCRRCVAVCDNVQGIGVTGANHRGFATNIGSALETGLGEASRISYGQYITVCSTRTLTKKDYTGDILAVIVDPTKYVIVQTASAVRAGLSEKFGLSIGTDVEGKVAAALRRSGFDRVFDTNSSADLTITEEVHEFLDRVQSGDVLPLITFCSPGWVKYCEHRFPDMIENLSSCKSPWQMFGAIARSYYAEKAGIDPKNIVSVSVMLCIAKKFEIGRDDQGANSAPDMDIFITTRELACMIKKSSIRLLNLPDEKFDDPLGLGTGATVTFDVIDDVMEAALRTAVGTLTDGELPKLDSEGVHDIKGIKKTAYNVTGMDVKVVVASGLGNARELLEKVKPGEADYHSIEIMGCPGGCVNDDGQLQQPGYVRNTTDIHSPRAKVLHSIDSANPIRKSHENPAVKELYSIYLDEPGSERAYHLFHTTYVKRTISKKIVNRKPSITIEVGGH